jgi:hypothetical protein
MGTSLLSSNQLKAPLFHVGATALPIGQVLRPYAIAEEHAALLRQAARALAEGPAAVDRILSGPEWTSLRGQPGQPAPMVLLEATFEHVRARIAPSFPSRLDAVFAWRSLGLARRFCLAHRRGGVIHRCEVVEGFAVERDGAFVVEAFETTDLTNPSPADLRLVEDLASRYWQGNGPMTFPEMLICGSVAVVEIVTTDEPRRSGE